MLLPKFDNLNNFSNTDSFEDINTQLQNQLAYNYNLQHNENQNVPLANDSISQFINMFMNMGGPNANSMPLTTQTFTFNLGGGNVSNVQTPLLSQVFNGQNTFASQWFTGIFQGMGNLGQANFNDPVPVALTNNALNSIKDLTYEEVIEVLNEKNKTISDDETCSVCFSTLTEDKDNYKYCVLHCNHVFHSQCIKPYLKDYDYHCPICRESCGDHEAKIEI